MKVLSQHRILLSNRCYHESVIFINSISVKKALKLEGFFEKVNSLRSQTVISNNLTGYTGDIVVRELCA